MFESKYNKFLTIVLIVVAVAILGLLGFLGYNYFMDSQSTQDASDFVTQYEDDILKIDKNKNKNNEGDEDAFGDIESASTGEKDSSTGVIKKKQYNGYNVDGTMRIPKINFSYPVLEKMTVKSLESAVAVLTGSGLNQVGNTVIVGHNYRNGRFFSNNKKLSNGDKIYITDYQGGSKTYVIYKKFETTPEDTSFYQRDTNGKAEITLSTCTDDSKARLIILAKEE